MGNYLYVVTTPYSRRVHIHAYDCVHANTLFLFCGKRADRIKALHWDADGFVLLYKRLEQGNYQWPRTPAEVQELTQRQLRWLQGGLAIEQPKAHHSVKEIGEL